MAVKRKFKGIVHVCLPRRTKRHAKFTSKESYWNFIKRKPSKSCTHIDKLPDEVLLKVFSHFDTKELYCVIRSVCRRWRVLAMSPILWKEIEVKNEVPTNTLTFWIRTSPLLKHFSVQDRNDTDIIIEQLVKSCKHLESLKMQNCWGTPKSCFIRSTPLCNLVTRCPNLRNFNFTQSRFVSRKFFRLMSRNKRSGKVMKCDYVGPMTVKQMRALFSALVGYEVHDTASIGNVNFTQRFKLRDLIHYFQELQNQVVNDVWEYLYYGSGDEDLVYPMHLNG